MLVGEQPGDEEDKKGLPFVGPAGRLLDRALEAAGVDRAAALRDQRGQAFQVAAARQAPSSQDTRAARGRCVPPVARARDRHRQAESGGGSRRDRRAGGHQQGFQFPCSAASSSTARSRPMYSPPCIHRRFFACWRTRSGIAFKQFVKDLSLIKKALAKAIALPRRARRSHRRSAPARSACPRSANRHTSAAGAARVVYSRWMFGQPAAQHDDVGIEKVDHHGEGAREAIL